jgi:uncharacterized alkaline shock family protein YloU
MKVINVFAQVFSIFSFLTLGSLLMIVSLHILSVEDAVFKVRELYGSHWQSFQTAVVGILFILVGLIFSKTLVKHGRESDAVIFQSDRGPVIVSINAIEDVVKRVLKKFSLVKGVRIKTIIQGKNIEIKLRLSLWAGSDLPQILAEIQEDVASRVKKILGPENKLEVLCDVQHIEDHKNMNHSVQENLQETTI